MRSQFGEREVQEHPKLYILGIYHIVAQSQLKYPIGAKVQSLQKCGTSRKTVGLVLFGFFIWENPLQLIQLSSDPDLEPTC
jgi:hypothetical protein